jgi:large subunit ribosomal protein L25
VASIQINAEPRTTIGKGMYALRTSGKIPAVIYGPAVPPTPIQIDAREATRLLSRVAGSQLVDVMLEGKAHSVLLREVQRDSIRRDILHVDFYEVPTDRVIRVRIPIEFVGVSPAVRDLSGVMVHLLDQIEVECLPKDLLSHIEVDVSVITEIGHSISVRDIHLPEAIRVLLSPEDSVATVMQQAAEEVVEPVVAAAVPIEPEVIERGKKEEEVPEEGEAPKK